METPDSQDLVSASAEPAARFAIPGSATRRLGKFGMALILALFALMSVVPPSGQALLPWLTAPLSGLAAFHFLRRAFDGRPRLTVDSEGITDRTSLGGGEIHVPWRDVLGVSVSRGLGTVELTVRDPVAVRTSACLARRLWMRLGHMLGKRTITITPTLLGVGKEALRDRLDANLLEFERRELGLRAPRTGNPRADQTRIR